MNSDTNPQLMLRSVLLRNPRASLDEIRSFHPIFRSMSFDQLNVRLLAAIDSCADRRGK